MSERETVKGKKKEISDLENQIGRVKESNKKEMDSVKGGYLNQINNMDKQANKVLEEKEEAIRDLGRKGNKLENELKLKGKNVAELTTKLEAAGSTI